MAIWIILSLSFGGIVGFVICSLMTIARIDELEEENAILRGHADD